MGMVFAGGGVIVLGLLVMYMAMGLAGVRVGIGLMAGTTLVCIGSVMVRTTL